MLKISKRFSFFTKKFDLHYTYKKQEDCNDVTPFKIQVLFSLSVFQDALAANAQAGSF